MFNKLRWDLLAGLLLVLVMHGALLYAAWSYKLIPPPQEAVTLFVNLINPPPLKKEVPPPELPKPPPPKKVTLVNDKPVVRPQQVPILVAEAPVVSVAEPVAPLPPAEPIIEAPEPITEVPAKSTLVTLSSDLALACPHRTPPNYPKLSRRLGEHGHVKLRVELDETGRITSAQVLESSGYKRLDEAGLEAVKTWHCNAATRNGTAVRAVALQPFDFILN